MHNCTNIQNQSQNNPTKKNRSNGVLHMDNNNLINYQVYNHTNTNVTCHQKVQQHHHIPPPLSSNMQLINSPSSSVRRMHSSNELDDDLQQVMNKKK
ncbi:unnamed protein product [Rotaria sp. Silwood1]|nr:unnamed protein product [Rotaria sp. Silwood1]CAF3402427.1 unnamed protein product [Rotaria sp. Silwood1]CAF3428773.1 unnamed protein product [Rotaria sp. Silwood1]